MINIYKYIIINIHTYMHTYIHIYIYIYIHACMHACMHTYFIHTHRVAVDPCAAPTNSQFSLP